MAQLLFILPLFLAIITAAALPTAATTTRNGLALNLINRFCSKNLTDSELIRKLIKQSQARISHIRHLIHMRTNRINTANIRPRVHIYDRLYAVSVFIGTGDAKQSYDLHMDTGSSLTWTQCLPCDSPYPISSPIFNPMLSPSFVFLPCTDPLCVEPYVCENNVCTYHVTYEDNSFVNGIIARDTFTFNTSTGVFEMIQGLAFGCTRNSHKLGYPENVHGLMGLGADPDSFVTQLGPRYGGRFSYCLIPYGDTNYNVPYGDTNYNVPDNFLRFGDAITMNEETMRTPINIHNGFYYLGLNGLSIDGQRLNIPPATFDLDDHGDGGCIIDSGSSISYLIRPAFNVVKEAMIHYFNGMGLDKDDDKYDPGIDSTLEVCYRIRGGIVRFPSMTFHFNGGADWTVGSRGLFRIISSHDAWVFCLMIGPAVEHTIIGAFQQTNTRFTHDVENQELLFAYEDCSIRG